MIVFPDLTLDEAEHAVLILVAISLVVFAGLMLVWRH